MSFGNNRETSSGRTGRGMDKDTYDPQHWGVRNIAARDGYDAGDGYMLPNPQLWSRSSRSSQRPIRRDSSASYGSDDEEYDRATRGRGLRKYKSYEDRRYNDYSDEDEDEGDGDRRRQDRGGMMRRSMSKLRTTVKDALGGDEEDDGKNNSEVKKWAATVGGALVGGFAGRRAQKDNWVPTAIGALVGGFTARELEKTFYRRQDAKREEEDGYEGGRSKSRSRSRQ